MLKNGYVVQVKFILITKIIYVSESILVDNISQQSEEVEALISIFGDKLQIDNTTGMCSIDISKNIKLYLTMVPEYPSHSLPNYDMLAPELSIDEKQFIDNEFQKIFE